MKAAILTINDGVANGKREDLSGRLLRQLLTSRGMRVVVHEVVPDEVHRIQAALLALCEVAELVVTTGGTGISERDVTPEATAAMCEKQLPGMAELMRAEGVKKTPTAALGRGLCGTRGKSLIVNLPGSPQGAVDSLTAVLHLVPHAVELLAGKTAHHKAELKQ